MMIGLSSMGDEAIIYLMLKTLHIVAVMSWMAGLLYLPRLFVYHAGVDAGSASSEVFKVMERRLLKAIMTPAMIVAWAAGLALAYIIGAFHEGWFHGKLLAIIIMTATHFLLARHVSSFARDENHHSHRYFRVINEIPTVLMILAVALVVFKP